ncbi:MAG: EamA family transporter RarD [Chloroflexi bacterium]|nr:EamA family transporter RarD [Chloroflexota bacterium]
MKNGTLAALGAYVMWGLFPIYWKTIEHVPAPEILSHRVVWSLVVAVLLLGAQRQWGWLRWMVEKPVRLLPFAGTALLLSINWLTYLWANNNGHIVETSLGYFINPLVNVLLGVVFLRERMRPWQWAAIGLATAGVAYLTFGFGRLTWIALTLALSFGFYGLIRKTAALRSVEGLAAETGLMFLPALCFLIYLAARGTGSFATVSAPTTTLLAFAGFATATPLILFAYGARRVPLTTLGVLQYAAPTLQFLVGVLIYGESFTQTRLIGFSVIWVALLLYSIEGLVTRRRLAQAAAMG